MVFFGHLGPTVAAVKIYGHFNKKVNKNSMKIDYRVVMLGSMLPDLIDKPIGAFLFRNTFHNSRIFCHSLIFSFLLLLIGFLYFRKSKNNNVILLGVCSLIHQILDSMWLYPKIFYWPFTGWVLPQRPEGQWLASTLTRLLTDPYYYVPEAFGFTLILYYFIPLIREKKLTSFFKYGKL